MATPICLKEENDASHMWESERHSVNEVNKFSSKYYSTSPAKMTEIYKEFFSRFQEAYYTGDLSIANSQLSFTRCDDIDSFSAFKIACESSFIMVEKSAEKKQEKPVESIHKWGNVDMSSTPKRSTCSTGTTRISDMDITGSPLACHFEDFKQPVLDLTLQGSFELRNLPIRSFKGFAVKEARSILAWLKKTLESVEERNLPPFWIACQGPDNSKTAFLGLHINENGKSTCVMKTSGPHLGAENLPSLDLINAQFDLGSLLPRVHNNVAATYEVRSPKDSRRSTLELKCRWTRPLFTLSPPGHEASTTASLQLEVGDPKSEAHWLFTELEFLRNLIQGLETKCLKWYQRDGEATVEQRLLEYFANFNDKGIKKQSCRKEVTDLDKIVGEKFVRIRPELEFMDDMWNILKGSENLAELSDGFTLMFKNISAGVIRPKMHARSELEVVVICRDLMRGQRTDSSFSDLEPIHMLIELGLEKIKKDYISFFEAYDLVASEQLSSYTSWTSKKLPLSDCLLKLEKMHLVLQIVVLLRCSLNLPNSVLSHYTSKTLLDLEKKSELPKEFEFEVETSLIKSVIDNIVPSIWVYETWSECEESPSTEKWLKFAVKKDEPFFYVGDEEEKDVFSPLKDNGSPELSVNNFYCVSVVKTGICI